MISVTPGSTAIVLCRFVDTANNILVDPVDITVTIKDPDDNVINYYTYPNEDEKIERLNTGIYRCSYIVPEDAETGIWHDVWSGVSNGILTTTTGNFRVIEGTPVTSSTEDVLQPNTIYQIIFSPRIMTDDGEYIGKRLIFSFTTTLTPFYTTVLQILNAYGEYLTDVSDMDIAIAIHDASLETYAFMPTNVQFVNSEQERTYNIAIRRYTVCAVGYKLLGNILGEETAAKRKRLSDFDVSRGASTGILDAYKDAEKCMNKWRLALQSSGYFYDRVSSKTADTGRYSADRMDFGRTVDTRIKYAEIANTSLYRRGANGLGRRPVRTWIPGGREPC